MKACIRDTAATVTAVSTAVVLAACGAADTGNDPDGGNGPRIGLLLPDATTARWETQDRPLLEKRIGTRAALVISADLIIIGVQSG